MIAVQTGTTKWRAISVAGDAKAGEVVYNGPILIAADRRTPLMVWDATANNIRVMTTAEQTAFPAQKASAEAAARDAAEPDLVAFRDNSAAALTEIDADITATQDSAMTLNALRAAVRRALQRERRALKAQQRLIAGRV